MDNLDPAETDTKVQSMSGHPTPSDQVVVGPMPAGLIDRRQGLPRLSRAEVLRDVDELLNPAIMQSDVSGRLVEPEDRPTVERD